MNIWGTGVQILWEIKFKPFLPSPVFTYFKQCVAFTCKKECTETFYTLFLKVFDGEESRLSYNSPICEITNKKDGHGTQ